MPGELHRMLMVNGVPLLGMCHTRPTTTLSHGFRCDARLQTPPHGGRGVTLDLVRGNAHRIRAVNRTRGARTSIGPYRHRGPSLPNSVGRCIEHTTSRGRPGLASDNVTFARVTGHEEPAAELES